MSARIGNDSGFVPPPQFEQPAVPIHAQDAAPEQAPDHAPQAPSVDEFIDADAGLKAQIQDFFKQEFGAWAADMEQFHALMRDVFWPETPPATPADAGPGGANGPGATDSALREDSAITTAIEQYRQMALKNDYSWLPPIEFVDDQVLRGANAAYDAEDRLVLINNNLRGDISFAGYAYVEETGHHLDNLLHEARDTAGDEGELFRRIISGEKLSDAVKAEIRAENDHGQIDVNGKKVDVEFWSPMTIVRKVFRFFSDGSGGGRMKFVGTAPVGKHKPRRKLEPRLPQPQPTTTPGTSSASNASGMNNATGAAQTGKGTGTPME